MITPGKISLMVGLVLALVWQNVEATKIGYRVENSRRQIVRLRAENASLGKDLETFIAPAQLALQAEARLGMHPAKPESLRILDIQKPRRHIAPWASNISRLWRTYASRLPLLARR